MGMVPQFEHLLTLTDEELIRLYDAEAEHTVIGTTFYMGELSRRMQARQAVEMLAFTKQVRNLTILITLLTVANVVLVVLTLVR